MIGKTSRIIIEKITDFENLNRLVCTLVLKKSNIYKNYATNISDCEELINKYSNYIIINTLNQDIDESGWHCNIRGAHSYNNSTLMEAVCKASLIYELSLWIETEEYQNKLKKIDIGGEEHLIIQNIISGN